MFARKVIVTVSAAGALGVGALATIAAGHAGLAGEPAGRVVVVKTMDEGGTFRFEPASVTVRRGDTVRFVQGGGTPHNVEFVRNTAPDGVDLGNRWVGAFLTGAGDAYDVPVDGRFADGRYGFICSPHAPLGMKGELVVRGGAAAPVAAGGRSSANATAALPKVKGVQGAQPIGHETDGNVKIFRLTVERVQWETKEGKTVEAWTFNRQVPGPTIRVSEGDRVRIVVTNKLPEGTTAHWHGLEVPNAMDGVPSVSQQPIKPGGSFAYEFSAKPAGTHLYHSHFNALHQEESGLYACSSSSRRPSRRSSAPTGRRS